MKMLKLSNANNDSININPRHISSADSMRNGKGLLLTLTTGDMVEVHSGLGESNTELMARVVAAVEATPRIHNELNLYHDFGEMAQDALAYGEQGYTVVSMIAVNGMWYAAYTKNL